MALLGELTYALIATSDRSIGGLIPDVVVEEGHRDGAIITALPVETGAAITDHAFLRPAEVEMRCGFSNSSHGDPGYARSVYDALRRLQAARRPFMLYTGKRRYTRMLIADLGVTTDARTENVLAVSVRLQQVIIVSAKTTGAGTSTAGAGASQANPASTGPVQSKGEIQPVPAALSPGGFNTEGGALGNGSFGLSPNQFGLDGLSGGPIEVTLPEQEVIAPSPAGTPGGNAAETYNIWEFG